MSNPNGLQQRTEYPGHNVSTGMSQSSDLHSSFLSSLGNNGQAVVAVSMNDENTSLGLHSGSLINASSITGGGGGIANMGGGIIHTQPHKLTKGKDTIIAYAALRYY